MLTENGIAEGSLSRCWRGLPGLGASCLQCGRAKVHVAMKYDYLADGSQIGGGSNSHGLVTFQPIFVNG